MKELKKLLEYIDVEDAEKALRAVIHYRDGLITPEEMVSKINIACHVPDVPFFYKKS